jgi:tRNA 2-thiouridine synthesizing protein A
LTGPPAQGHPIGVPDPAEILIDARGHRCPAPTLKLRRALEAAPAGARLRLLADDPMARIDVPHFLSQIGLELADAGEADGVLSFLVVKPVP